MPHNTPKACAAHCPLERMITMLKARRCPQNTPKACAAQCRDRCMPAPVQMYNQPDRPGLLVPVKARVIATNTASRPAGSARTTPSGCAQDEVRYRTLTCSVHSRPCYASMQCCLSHQACITI